VSGDFRAGRTEFHQGQLLRVGDAAIWYHDTGGGGAPLLLLGGPSVGHFHFDFARPHLAGFRLITWEPRGLGRSGDAPAYSAELWANDLRDLLDALALEAICIWANAFSSYIAYEFAARWPERVRALVGSTDVWAADPGKGYAAAWDHYRDIIEAHGTTGEGAAKLARLYAVADPPWFADWFAASVAEVMRPATAAATIGYCCTRADVRHRLAEVRAPVLVLAGDRSWDGAPLDVEADASLALMRSAIERLEVAVVHAHPVHLIVQQPALCADIVRRFFGVHTAPQSFSISAANPKTA
jgi:pimeloyl-ACP methyl ester carboxylesterase